MDNNENLNNISETPEQSVNPVPESVDTAPQEPPQIAEPALNVSEQVEQSAETSDFTRSNELNSFSGEAPLESVQEQPLPDEPSLNVSEQVEQTAEPSGFNRNNELNSFSGETPLESVQEQSESHDPALDSFLNGSPERENAPIEHINFENPKAQASKNHSGNKLAAVLLVIVLILVAALIIFCVFMDLKSGSLSNGASYSSQGSSEKVVLNTNSKPDSKDENLRLEDGTYSTEGIAVKIRPQIVDIYTYSNRLKKPLASGSGVIITEDGYIVTNTHVLESSDYFKVKLSNGKEYNGQLIGRDAKTDIAVIKIEETGLPVAELGNSDEVVLGEKVVAIGNPAGLSGSVTDGIVSGLDRKIKTDVSGYEMNCIQTNAAISPGNSGGALVNMHGQLIGITSSKYASASYEGLGFAITINEAKPIIEDIISNGYVSGRVRIGIEFYSMDTDYAKALFEEEYGYEAPDSLSGLWVTSIKEGFDIANTELQEGDFITEAEGVKITNYDDLLGILKTKKGGDTLKLKCLRIEKDDTSKKMIPFEIEFRLSADTSGDF